MKVSEKDVAYVAELANLELTPAERARLLQDLNAILEHIERLNQLDTTNVPPMAQVAMQGAPLRPDENRPSLSHDEAMGNAPATDGTFFLVPKVIEK